MGKVVGAHGVRGSLRVDAPSAVDVEMALAAAGLRYLRLASRRTPRPVVVASCRELKRFGATVRYVVALKGLNEREEAARLAASRGRELTPSVVPTGVAAAVTWPSCVPVSVATSCATGFTL